MKSRRDNQSYKKTELAVIKKPSNPMGLLGFLRRVEKTGETNRGFSGSVFRIVVHSSYALYEVWRNIISSYFPEPVDIDSCPH